MAVMDYDTRAKNMKVPEDVDGLDIDAANITDVNDFVEDIDADMDDDEDYDLNEKNMLNPISMTKSDSDEDDDDEEDDDMDKADCGDDDEDEDTLKKQARKGGLTPGNLRKSIARLAAYAEARDPVSRKNALLRRAQSGAELSKSEKSELFAILGDAPAEAAPRRLSKSLNTNETIQKSLDASDFLAAQHSELVGALDSMEKSFGALSARNQEFSLVLAQAVANIGKRVEQMSKSMQQAESLPARAPKSIGAPRAARPLAKSGMSEGGITHHDVANALDGMMQKSLASGRNGNSESGVPLMRAIAHFDSCGELIPEIQGDLHRFVRDAR